MDIIIKIIQFFLCFTILVGIHELGHFLMARVFKIRVDKFYIFFDPWFSIFKFKRGDTEYGLGWLPLGGYCKIAGMIDESMDKEQMKLLSLIHILIMEGKTPVARVLANSDSTRATKVLVMPSPEDSVLRAQMEGDGEYAVTGRSGGSRRSVREAIELATPVEGIITDRFDIRNGNFGIRIAAAASDRIAARCV